ncbi:MAG: hypothetical protein ACC652_08720 [Acidimicrobiales bacterium]
MTETREAEVIVEALGIIDDALLTMSGRNLVSTTEVADLLLDVRMLLKSTMPDPVAPDVVEFSS